MKNILAISTAFEQKGWNWSQKSRAVYDILKESILPMSVIEISETFTKNFEKNINRTTVYRIIERFLSIKVLHEINEKYVLCSHPEKTNTPHHFLVCQETGRVEEIFLDYEKHMKKELLKKKGFELKKSEIIFYGVSRFYKYPKSLKNE